MAGSITNVPRMKEPHLKQRQQSYLNVLFSTSLFYIFFVPVGLLISCDFFFNAPYSRLILSNSPAGVFVIHNSQSNVND